MANPIHVELLRTQAAAWAKWKAENRTNTIWGDHHDYVTEQVLTWNVWRREHPDIVPDLSGAMLAHLDLSYAYLSKTSLNRATLVGCNLEFVYAEEADLSEANLEQAKFREGSFRRANLYGARLGERLLEGSTFGGANLARMDFAGADLRTYLYGVDFYGSDLSGANLSGCACTTGNFSTAKLLGTDLSNTGLSGANFAWADLRNARLCGALMRGTSLVEADLTDADISGARIYGVSAWDVKLDGCNQSNLIITRDGKSSITVDDLEVAQFVYLLLDNAKLRNVIHTIGKKAVLILGNFSPARKLVLDAIRDVLRERGYLPIVFDFLGPSNRDTTETISILAGLSRFIIADITEARSIPQELQAIAPNLLSVPVQPILLSSEREYGMFDHFKRFPHILTPHLYNSLDELLVALPTKCIEPAEAKAKELTGM